MKNLPSRSAFTSMVIIALMSGCSGAGHGDAEKIQPEKTVIASEISLDDSECGKKGLPIGIVLRNNTDEATSRLGWWFSVGRKNHSTELADRMERFRMVDLGRTTDRIIQPGQTFKVCSSAPMLSENYPAVELEWRVFVEDKNIL